MNQPKVEFYRHGLEQEEMEACLATLRSLFLTTGPACARAEKALAQYLGVPEVVTVATCTAALELALLALGVGPG